MLQKLNEGISGWVSTLIIVVVSISFLIFGISYYLTSHSGVNAVIAEVGKTSITNQQLETALRKEQFVREREQGALDAKQLNFLKQMVFAALVQRATNEAALDGLGLVMSSQTVEDTIRSLPAFSRAGQYDSELLKRYLANYGMSLEQFMEQFSHQLRRQQLNLGLGLSAVVLPKTVEAMRIWADQTRSFRYVSVSPKQFVADLVVTPKQIMDFYQNHQQAYQLPDRVKVNYLRLDPQLVAKQLQVTEQQVKQFYTQHRNQFREAATYRYADIVVLHTPAGQDDSKEQKTVAAIDQAVTSGKTVQQLASRFGGSIQSSTADQLNDQMLALLQQLQPGQQVSHQTVSAGTVWLQLLSVKPGAVKSYAAVKKQIRARLLSQQTQKRMAALTEQLSDLTYTESVSLEPAAKKLGLTVQQSGWLSKTGRQTGLFANKKLLSAAFSNEVLKLGDNSMPVSLKDGSVVVLRVQQFQQAQTQPLKAVKAQVLQAVKQQAAELKAALLAEQIQQALQNKQGVSALLKQNRLRWTTAKQVKRSDSTLPAALLHAAFLLDQPQAVTTVVQTGGATAVVQLQSIQLPTQRLTDKHKQQLTDSLQVFLARIEAAAVIGAAEKSVRLKRYPERMV